MKTKMMKIKKKSPARRKTGKKKGTILTRMQMVMRRETKISTRERVVILKTKTGMKKRPMRRSRTECLSASGGTRNSLKSKPCGWWPLIKTGKSLQCGTLLNTKRLSWSTESGQTKWINSKHTFHPLHTRKTWSSKKTKRRKSTLRGWRNGERSIVRK